MQADWVKIVDNRKAILNAGVTRDNHGGPGIGSGPSRRSWNPTLAAKNAAGMGHPRFKKPQPLRAGSPDPSLRSGFRQQAPTFPFAKLRVRLTPAKRLNLLKKFRASTLTTLRKERTRLLGKRQTGRVHG